MPEPGKHAKSSFSDLKRKLIPTGSCHLEERRLRADHARRAYMLGLAKRSATARKPVLVLSEKDHL
jgi:hypothetical protein